MVEDHREDEVQIMTQFSIKVGSDGLQVTTQGGQDPVDSVGNNLIACVEQAQLPDKLPAECVISEVRPPFSVRQQLAFLDGVQNFPISCCGHIFPRQEVNTCVQETDLKR